jgi:RNA polymerase sigma factor (sigma-70 family)
MTATPPEPEAEPTKLERDDGDALPEDFEAFFQRTLPGTLTDIFILSRHHRQDAEDALQEAYAEALRRWDQRLRDYDAPDMWVRKVAAQRLLRSWRRRLRLQLVPPDELPLPLSPGVEETVELRLLLDDVLREMRNLPGRQLRVMQLCCVQGRSPSDVASEMGITESAIRTHLHKGRKRLREALGIHPGSWVPQHGDQWSSGATAGPGVLTRQAPEVDALTPLLRWVTERVRQRLMAQPGVTARIRDGLITAVTADAGRRGSR